MRCGEESSMHWKSSDETTLSPLHIPFSQLFLTKEGVLCRKWKEKPEVIIQWVILQEFVSTVLELVHDQPLAGHPGRDRTLASVRRKYYWPRMRVDVEDYVA